jgi:hypothetical protein
MRRTVLVLSAIAVSCAVPSAFAAHGHTEKGAYQAPGGAQDHDFAVNILDHHYGFTQLRSTKSDRFVRVSVVDASGLPVSFDVEQWDAKAPGGAYQLGTFCSQSTRLRLPSPGRSVVVYPKVGACAAGPSIPTQGKVTATYR